MVQREELMGRMKERGFTHHSTTNNKIYSFLTESERDNNNRKRAIISISINIETEEFECTYCLDHSITRLTTGLCGSVMNDKHFDNIVSKFESEANWLSRLS